MIILSSAVYFTHNITLINFFESSTSLFDTLLNKKNITYYESGLALFIMYNSFATTKLKIFILSSSSSFACLLTLNM